MRNKIGAFAGDCIHLKACRRMSKIARNNGYCIARWCNADCSAYETEEEFYQSAETYVGWYTTEDVKKCIDGACMDGKRGYYPGDLLISDYVEEW